MVAMLPVIRPVSYVSAASRDLAGMVDAFAHLVTLEAGADKATEADYELLACCREAEAANREAAAVMNSIEALDDDDAAVMPALEAATPLFVAYSDAVLRAGQLRARTPEGLRAKAALLLLHLTTDDDPVALAASLARDVAGRA
ncbi:MAG: hypothetical protein ACRYHQ_34325 [Janthinobacterium lividum]